MNLEKLKEVRTEKGISYQEMASKLDVTMQFYWMIENGKRKLSYEMAVKIAAILESTPDQIFLNPNVTCS